MPAKSLKQKELMEIAEHHPDEVSAKDSSVLSMSNSQIHDFAATPQSNLPAKKKPFQSSSGPKFTV